MINERLRGGLDHVDVDPIARKELAARQDREVNALGSEAQEEISREAGNTERPSVSLWERAKQWRTQNLDRITAVKAKKEDGTLTREYGKSTVNSKFKYGAENLPLCQTTYLDRRQATGRPLPSENQM